MGAGLPANTGGAGAIHRVGFFAGTPAPTGGALVSWVCKPLQPSAAHL
ncbi:diguanylate cyclase [Pseudomonas monteilii]|uniref:Diguanylate cyclase n=1 Tax=Pseudomonas monteilii TaxID=76759 RepID=A0A399MGJ7_9PSED|nr:diguanylate cyclase [Pseudomonas monteilii]